MHRGHDTQHTPTVPQQRDIIRKLPNRDRPPYVQNTSFPGMDPMKTDFASTVQEFERLKVAQESRQNREQATDRESPHTPAWAMSQVGHQQTRTPSLLAQNFDRRDATSLRNVAYDMMADCFPNASPTAILGFVTELFIPKQTRFAIRQSLRAFGDPRVEISFEAVAEEFVRIAEEANSIQPPAATPQVGATSTLSAFLSTPQVMMTPGTPQVSNVPLAPQTISTPGFLQTNTAPGAPQTAATVPQTVAAAPGAPQVATAPLVTPSAGATPAAGATTPAGAAPPTGTNSAVGTPPATGGPAVTQTTNVADELDESSIETNAKIRRGQAKAGIIHYINCSPQSPFKAQSVYQVLKKSHILTFYQSISASKIAQPEVPTANLLPGDLYIHYNSTTMDSQENMQGQLWVWPTVSSMGWQNKSTAYTAQSEILHPVFDNMSLYFSPSKAWEPNYNTKDYVKKQRVKEAGNQVMSASASSRSRG